MYKRQQVQIQLGLEAGEDLARKPDRNKDEEPDEGLGGHGNAWTDR